MLAVQEEEEEVKAVVVVVVVLLVDGAGVGNTLRSPRKTRFFYLQVKVSMTNRLNETSPPQINTERETD